MANITVPFEISESTENNVVHIFEEALEQHLNDGWKPFRHMRYVYGDYQSPIIYTMVK